MDLQLEIQVPLSAFLHNKYNPLPTLHPTYPSSGRPFVCIQSTPLNGWDLIIPVLCSHLYYMPAIKSFSGRPPGSDDRSHTV